MGRPALFVLASIVVTTFRTAPTLVTYTVVPRIVAGAATVPRVPVTEGTVTEGTVTETAATTARPATMPDTRRRRRRLSPAR